MEYAEHSESNNSSKSQSMSYSSSSFDDSEDTNGTSVCRNTNKGSTSVRIEPYMYELEYSDLPSSIMDLSSEEQSEINWLTNEEW